MDSHTSRHTGKNSSFSTQDEHLGLLGLEALTDTSDFHSATRSSYHCIPTPRDAIAHLLRHADIKLPKAFALSGTRVATKKKLQSERLVL